MLRQIDTAPWRNRRHVPAHRVGALPVLAVGRDRPARPQPGHGHEHRLQAFVKVNPVSHLTAAARDLMNAAITVVFAPLTLHLYGKQD
jgi:hypothetical protein